MSRTVRQLIALCLLLALSAGGKMVLPGPELAGLTTEDSSGSSVLPENLILTVRFADGTSKDYRYDAAGNLVFERKRDGTVVYRIYDDGSRLCEVRTLDATVSAGAAFDALDPVRMLGSDRSNYLVWNRFKKTLVLGERLRMPILPAELMC